MNTSVSVVIAAYNEAAHLGRLLTSLSCQTLRPSEVIVVDDGSTDATAEIAFAHHATVLRQHHRGPARARNRGVAQAQGEIIVFLDGDMSCAPQFIERLVAPVAQGGAVGSFTKDIYIGNVDNRWSRAYAHIRQLPLPRVLPEDFADTWENYRAIRRRCFVAVGGYDDVGYGEDMTLAAKVGEPAVVAPDAVCFHYNPASLSEITENGRWIGRGRDIMDLPHPWRQNCPLHAISAAWSDWRRERDLVAFPARLGYHFGVLLGLASRAARPDRHWK